MQLKIYWAHRVLCAAVLRAALPALAEREDLEPCANYMGRAIQYGMGLWFDVSNESLTLRVCTQHWIVAFCLQPEKLIV